MRMGGGLCWFLEQGCSLASESDILLMIGGSGVEAGVGKKTKGPQRSREE